MNMNYEDENIGMTEENEEVPAKKGGKSEKFLRICLVAVIAAVVIIAILASVVITIDKLGKEEETTLPPAEETTTAPVEITTSPAEKYVPGQYTVNVGGNGKLNLRKDPTKDGEQILAIDNLTLLTITEISYDPTAEPDSQYWGKTVYKGWEAWVSMKYLANAYSESVVTPAEVTTAPGEATTAVGATSAPSVEKTTAAEKTTASSVSTTAPAVNATAPAVSTTAPSTSTTAPAVSTTAASTETTTSGSGSATTAGTYTVTADNYLNMREDHDVTSLSVAQVPHGATVTVVDVYHDANSTNSYTKYWGKITYGGITGWVAMGYLK